MTINGNSKQRIACYGDKIAVIENGKVIKRIIIEEERLKNRIDQIIDKREVCLDPYHIFRKCLEDITGYQYFGKRNNPVIDGIEMSIHDQIIYKKWRDYILKNDVIVKMQESYRENLKERKKFKDYNRLILGANNPNFVPKRFLNNTHKK